MDISDRTGFQRSEVEARGFFKMNEGMCKNRLLPVVPDVTRKGDDVGELDR